MRNLILTCLLATISFISFGQQFGEIHGQLIDYESGEPLPFATVSTEYGGQTFGGVTDEDGRFKLKPLRPGSYDLKFRYVGYNERTIQGIEVTPSKIYMLGKVELAMDNTLPPVVIEGITLFDKDRPNAMVVKAADLKFNPLIKTPARLIGSLTPELRTDESGQFIVRSSRPGTSITLIDGIKVTGGMGNIPGSAIKTITVHTGGIPAQYGDLTGGVVVIETKGYFDYFYEHNSHISRR